MRITRPFAVALLLLAGACTETPAGPDARASRHADLQGRTLGILSRNLYVGADLDATIGALASPDPSDDLPALQTAIGTLLATDYTARAGAIADEIALTRPHVIGLQEVWQIAVNLTPLECLSPSISTSWPFSSRRWRSAACATMWPARCATPTLRPFPASP